MQILSGTVNIGTNIGHADVVDASQKQVIINKDLQSSKGEVNQNMITLNSKKGMKVNLFRIIIAMHKLGFFVDETGNIPDQEDVFKAFGDMLQKDYSKYCKDLSEASKKKNEVTIFQKLEKAFREYEEEKINRLEERR